MQQATMLARELRAAVPVLDQQARDTISWNLAGSGRYSTSSAYKAQLEGSNSCCFKKTIWKVWARGKNKMFLWLLHLNRLWCNDRLQRRGWPNGYFCPLCMRNLESSVHLIWDCPTAMQVWSTAATWGRCSALHPDVWTEGPTTSAKVGDDHRRRRPGSPERHQIHDRTYQLAHLDGEE